MAVRMRRSCQRDRSPELREIAADLALVLGLWHVPELRAGPDVARPMLVGALGRRSCCPSRCSATRALAVIAPGPGP